jgi:FkbM family methyltransferase
MRQLLKKTLRHFGYELYSVDFLASQSRDAFLAQQAAIDTACPVIFDVGAHRGETALRYRETFPSARIYCFEPAPEAYRHLVENVRGDRLISCHNLALTGTTGKAQLNLNTFSPTNSLLPTADTGASIWGRGLLETIAKVEVQTATLDTFCHDNHVDHIDILKLDTQGTEYMVLMGAQILLSQQQAGLIYTELILCNTYRGQRKLHEYLCFLDSLGYLFLDYYNPIRHQGRLIQADFLFMPSTSVASAAPASPTGEVVHTRT